MSHIYIGFSRPRSFPVMSWVIKTVERTSYSHVYMRIYIDQLDKSVVYHAANLNIHFIGFKQFDKKNETVHEFALKIDDKQKMQIISFCVDEAGKPYGFWQLIGIGVVKFVKIFGKKIKNPFASKDRTQVCSEAIGLILQRYFNIEIDKCLDLLTPKDLYKTLQQHCDQGKCKIIENTYTI